MYKTKQFNTKESYVSPCVEIAAVRARGAILAGSIFDSNQHTERYFLDADEDL